MTINPRQPCEAPAGSLKRIEMYRARYAAGLPVLNENDNLMLREREDRGQSHQPKMPAIKRCRLNANCPPSELFDK